MNALLLNRDGFQMPSDGWYQVAPFGEFAHAQAELPQFVGVVGLGVLCLCLFLSGACGFCALWWRGLMNALLLNRDGFQTPADGWYQVAPMGEFAHAQAGLTQVVDADACTAMANRFAEEAKGPNFAGLLVDFDHFSLDGEKRSEAAGWITALENRDGGLFAKIRWSDVGEEAVKGGRYRFLSPVWNRADCVDLGGGRVRPVRLLNAAVTNDPNLKGMRPLSNSGRIANSVEPRFKWVLGDSPGGRHCPSCAAVAGQVHTMAEWNASGVTPGAGGLYCQGNCHGTRGTITG